MKEIKVFSASWCPTCQVLKKLLTAQNIEFTEVDVDSDAGSALASSHGVRGLPTTLVLVDGEVVSRYVSVLKPAEIDAVNKV